MSTERCGWTQTCGLPQNDHAHTDPKDMHPGLYRHAFTPTDPTPRTAATARERDVERVLAEALHIPEWPCDHRQYDPPQCVRAARSILAGSPTLPAALAAAEAPGRVSEFRALVDEARANHVLWDHPAEVLEECIRPLCIGAKVLLWPDIENPRSSALAAPASPAGVSGEGWSSHPYRPRSADDDRCAWEPSAGFGVRCKVRPNDQRDAEVHHHPVPAPTPSEPVARAEAMVPAWMLARTYSLLPVDRVALVDDEVNEAIARYLDSTLAATAPAPSDPVECVGCAEHGIHHPSGTPITHRSSAPAPTPSEPVERVRAEYEAWLDEAIAKAKRWRDAGTLTESEYAAAMAVLFVTDAKPTDEEMERIRAMCIERGWTAAPAPTPSEPVGRCGSEHDWETRHPGDLAVCRRCWTVESDTTPATRDE